MRLRLTFLLVSSVSCGAWLFAQGCGGDTATLDDGGNDGTTNPDNFNPPPPDSGNPDVVVTPDTGAPDTGGGDGGVQPDGSSSGIAFQCGFGPDAGTVSDCSQCANNPEPCVYCQFGDASVMTGRCTQMNGSCFNISPNGYGFCPCAGGDAGACPESYQVCRQFNNQFFCRTCSDSQNNNGLTCKSGGTCNNVDGGCI
jgi:hypothetical protein